ncbi:MAG: exo-alpha-sialidase [Verrucomicrobiales bacterium]|nr:exo-alpha-sialidase [Verrucomicrobiales bacterium]
MKWILLVGALIGVPGVRAQQAFTEGQAELVKVEKIFEGAPHAAFTDLIRFNNLWYCCFRVSDGHAGGTDGKIKVLLSSTGKNWVEQAEIELPGVDLRDPKLEVLPDGRTLLLMMGGSVYEGGTLKGRMPHFSTTQDGKVWTPPLKLLGEGDWLWRVTLNAADSQLYGVAYNIYPEKGAPPEEPENRARLYSSANGSVWRLVADLQVPGKPNEATVRFLDGGRAVMLLRREGGDRKGVIGVSEPPYRQWSWTPQAAPLGGPNFIVLPDGSMVAGSRGFGKTPGAHMVLFKMTETSLEPVLELPSGGDCSYPGMVWHDGMLWVSYYSTHEDGKTSIYLAKVRLNWVK